MSSTECSGGGGRRCGRISPSSVSRMDDIDIPPKPGEVERVREFDRSNGNGDDREPEHISIPWDGMEKLVASITGDGGGMEKSASITGDRGGMSKASASITGDGGGMSKASASITGDGGGMSND